MMRGSAALCAGVVMILILLVPDAAGADERRAVTPVSAEEFDAVLAGHEGKVVLVNFWATWCAPCRHEIPALMEAEAALAGEAFAFVPLSMDDPETGEREVRAWIEAHVPEFRTYLRESPDMQEIAAVIDPGWSQVMPTTYILDCDGRVAQRIQGLKSAEEFAAAVRAHL